MSEQPQRPRPKAKRGRPARIQPYLPTALRQRFTAYCAATGTTESAVVQAALKQYLDGTSDQALIIRRMDRLGRAIERLERDLGLLSEAFAVWVQIWFAHAPTIPASGRDTARRESAGRFQQYVAHVATRLSAGKRFVDNFAKEKVADDAELASIIQAANRGHDAEQEEGEHALSESES